jgi:hypothetical protein
MPKLNHTRDKICIRIHSALHLHFEAFPKIKDERAYSAFIITEEFGDFYDLLGEIKVRTFSTCSAVHECGVWKEAQIGIMMMMMISGSFLSTLHFILFLP